MSDPASRVALDEPRRIQRYRHGWDMPDDAVYVGPDSRWANPFLLTHVGHRFPSLTLEQCQGFVYNQFRDLLRSDQLRRRHSYPSLDLIRQKLHGKDLVCWCALSEPCHADLLIEAANG